MLSFFQKQEKWWHAREDEWHIVGKASRGYNIYLDIFTWPEEILRSGKIKQQTTDMTNIEIQFYVNCVSWSTVCMNCMTYATNWWNHNDTTSLKYVVQPVLLRKCTNFKKNSMTKDLIHYFFMKSRNKVKWFV